MEAEVVIVGGGLAGLACALELHQKGISFILCEASDRVGGRVASDRADGFIFDRGFQVLLEAYPEAQALLDYDALGLGAFLPGALIYRDNQVFQFADPLRAPIVGISGALKGPGPLRDKYRILKMRQMLRKMAAKGTDAFFGGSDQSSLGYLKKQGFDEETIEVFWRPWLSGIFLDPSLETSSHMLEFVFSMFSRGSACLPHQGMGAIAQQLVRKLPGESIRCNTSVVECSPTRVALEDGTVIKTQQAVIATDATSARRWISDLPETLWRSTAVYYFEAQRSPLKGKPWLVLNANQTKVVNHLCVPSDVSPSYASSGSSLVSASVVLEQGAQAPTMQAVQEDLGAWFDRTATAWVPIRSYVIPHALPALQPEALRYHDRQKVHDVVEARGWVVCGDYMEHPSIQGALSSGRHAGQKALKTLLKPALKSQRATASSVSA